MTELAALRQLPRQVQQQHQHRVRTESRDSEEQYQDAAEYLEPELIDLEGLYRGGQQVVCVWHVCGEACTIRKCSY